jgi:hypothetical protein
VSAVGTPDRISTLAPIQFRRHWEIVRPEGSAIVNESSNDFGLREIAGVRIPDSKAAKEATELVRQVSSPSIFNHAVRTYLFAELIGRKSVFKYDSELLYFSAIMHDLGLTEKFQGAERFEVDGADAAAAFLSDRNLPQDKIDVVWDAIALHTTVGIAHRKQPEAALVHFGAGVDAVGLRFEEIPANLVAEVLEIYPRLGFKIALLGALTEVVRRKPHTAAFNIAADVGRAYIPGFEAPNSCALIVSAPFSE